MAKRHAGELAAVRTHTTVLFAVALLLSATPVLAQQSPNAAFHASFRSEFKKSFISSCIERAGATPIAKTYCECAEANAEKHFSDQQLIALYAGTSTKEDQAALQSIIQQCAAEARAKPTP